MCSFGCWTLRTVIVQQMLGNVRTALITPFWSFCPWVNRSDVSTNAFLCQWQQSAPRVLSDIFLLKYAEVQTKKLLLSDLLQTLLFLVASHSIFFYAKDPLLIYNDHLHMY